MKWTFEVKATCTAVGDGTVIPTAEMLAEAIAEWLGDEIESANVTVTNLREVSE